MLSSPCFPHPPTQRLTQNTSESKNKRPSSAGSAIQDRHCDIVPLTSSYRLQSYSHPAGTPQSTAPFLQSARTTEEEGQQHISVIHATGSAASNSPLAVVKSHRETSPLPSRSSPKPILPSSPKHSSVCSSPKPLALCCPSKSLSLCSSPKPYSLSSLSKPPTLLASLKSRQKPKASVPSPKHTEIADGINERCASLPDGRALHLNSFKMKQVSFFFVFPNAALKQKK